LHNYEHKKLIESIKNIDVVPNNKDEFDQWLLAKSHLDLLKNNSGSREIIVYGVGKYFFVHAVVVPNEKLFPIDKPALIGWNFDPYRSIAGYITGSGRDDVWVERGLHTSSKVIDNGWQLIFGRTFEGWSGSDRNYFELHQEYAHLANIHWRPEKKAYCRYNEFGDLTSIVTVSSCNENNDSINLVTFEWNTLEEYLAATNSSLVRMFDFTLFKEGSFSGWSRELPLDIFDSDEIFYRQHIEPGRASFTRGIQIISLKRPVDKVFTDIIDGWSGRKNRKYVEFLAYDWRNNFITKISTDPDRSTNYFEAKNNNLPYELSPAFFKPEVLLKYKADKDKYQIGDRDITCRAAWFLKGIDINEAGQVHTYICYLRSLPYEEQLHWLSHNVEPKSSISKRAYINDFEGEFVLFQEPLQELLEIVKSWHSSEVDWWSLKAENLLTRVNTPITDSRDEWSDAFMDLAKLIIEGFKLDVIRNKLDQFEIQYDKEEKSIKLLERLVRYSKADFNSEGLVGLRTLQFLRTKLKGHFSGSDSEQIMYDALLEHETFRNHFRYVCNLLRIELLIIEKELS